MKEKIAIIEPFYGGSHKVWSDDLQRNFDNLDIYSLNANHWKWKMVAGAIELAKIYKYSNAEHNLIIGTSMLDFNTFLSMVKPAKQTKTAYYFHENQFSYPWSTNDIDSYQNRDLNYALINLKSALASDAVYFNSHYHMEVFFEDANKALTKINDIQLKWALVDIRKKSSVLPLGFDYNVYHNNHNKIPFRVVWNHRWEHDKNPELLFQVMDLLIKHDNRFTFSIVGKKYKNYPQVFDEIFEKFENNIIHFGPVDHFPDYLNILQCSEFCLSTANHDFFGISVIEALLAGCKPILPNRLAYPEHFKEKILLYQDIADILKIIKTDHKIILKNYNWNDLKEIYSEAFSKI